MSFYCTYEGNIIHGLGASPEKSLNDAKEWFTGYAYPEWETILCSPLLYEKVLRYGGKEVSFSIDEFEIDGIREKYAWTHKPMTNGWAGRADYSRSSYMGCEK